MLTLEQIKDWLKTQVNIGDGIAVGSIDGSKQCFIGVYDLRVPGKQRICIGGAAQTKYQEKRISILIHWTKSAVQAEAKAQEVYSVLYGKSHVQMGSTSVISIDPGAAPIPVGKDNTGICEYVIEATILYERNE